MDTNASDLHTAPHFAGEHLAVFLVTKRSDLLIYPVKRGHQARSPQRAHQRVRAHFIQNLNSNVAQPARRIASLVPAIKNFMNSGALPRRARLCIKTINGAQVEDGPSIELVRIGTQAIQTGDRNLHFALFGIGHRLWLRIRRAERRIVKRAGQPHCLSFLMA